MMAAAYDISIWNSGAAMGMGGVKRIPSTLISSLFLVSDPISFFLMPILGECVWC